MTTIEGVLAYGRIVCICELGRPRTDTGGD